MVTAPILLFPDWKVSFPTNPFPGKFCMHWLGPYQVKNVTNGGVVQLAKLNGEMMPTLVNGRRIQLYRDSPPS